MDMRNFLKSIALMAFAVAATVLTAASVMAASPYDGTNRIGTMYQQQANFNIEPAYGAAYPMYGYPTSARAGAWFGSGTEWITGLRKPVYAPIAPVQYTSYYTPSCVWPCYTGAYGYQGAMASSGHYRNRANGF